MSIEHTHHPENTTAGVIMYGSHWCPFTQRAVRHIDSLGVPYRYIEVEDNSPEEALIASWNNGRSIRPTFDINGAHFVNPLPQQLENELRDQGLL